MCLLFLTVTTETSLHFLLLWRCPFSFSSWKERLMFYIIFFNYRLYYFLYSNILLLFFKLNWFDIWWKCVHFINIMYEFFNIWDKNYLQDFHIWLSFLNMFTLRKPHENRILLLLHLVVSVLNHVCNYNLITKMKMKEI